MPVSATIRATDLEQLAYEFNRHLLETPGNVLTGNLRCAVAQCARDALRDCGGCQSLPKDQKLKSGQKVFRRIHLLKHEPEFTASSDSRVTDAVVNLVHALVNHESKLDNDWYLSTIAALQSSHLIPSHITDDQARQFMVWSLFCEIALLTAISHGISLTFLVLDQEPPSLPQTSKTVPKSINFNDIKRSDRRVHQSDTISFAPYMKPSDVDITSPEIKKFSDAALRAFQHNMDVHTAKVAMIFAPEDLAFLDFMSDVYYLSPEEVGKPYKTLNDAARCSDQVSRHDVEVVALAVAESHGSRTFHQSKHEPLVQGSRDGIRQDHRTQALQKLAAATTRRPLDMGELQTCRTTIASDYSQDLLVEAAGVIGYSEAEGMVAHSTGRQALPENVQSMMSCVFACCGIFR